MIPELAVTRCGCQPTRCMLLDAVEWVRELGHATQETSLFSSQKRPREAWVGHLSHAGWWWIKPLR
ncbi:hypothetical protein LIA77_00580 [Sarocladium implicatum]|nr:hypothetical protein LIA77_00580 [Sarocladium implicatum]